MIQATDHDENTPLHLAAWKSHTTVAELLLDNGAPIHAINQFTIPHDILLHGPVTLVWWTYFSGGVP